MRYTKLIFTFLLFTFLSTSLFAQYPQWVSRYNGTGNGNDGATSIVVDDSGNVYVTGNSPGNGTGTDCATIKYNSAGVQQWVQRYNGPGNSSDVALSIGVDNSGNVYVAGCSVGSGTGNDYLAIKYNSNGDTLWVRRYNGTANTDDNALSAAIDGMGNVHLTGYTIDPYTGWSTIYLTIKYNSAGVLQWVNRAAGYPSFTCKALSITLDYSGNVYVTGQTGNDTSFVINRSDWLTVKYNSGGGELWRVYQDGPLTLQNSEDYAYSVGVDNLGYVYVSGHCLEWEWPFTSYDLTLSYPSGGGWYNYDWPDYLFSSFAPDNLGNMYAINSGTTAKLRVMYPGPIWSKPFGGTCNSIALDSSNNVHVTGSRGGDYGTIKYNSSGVQQWVHGYNGPGNSGDGASSIAVDNSGNVYVTGSSAGSGTGSDYATIKYSTTPSILNAFSLSSPPNGTQITTSILNDTLVNMKWIRSGFGITYKWKFGSPTIANPIFTFTSNNSGFDSVLSIRKGRLDSGLVSQGLQIGDSIIGEWAVWAYNGLDSLKSTQTFSMILKRIDGPVRFYDTFSYGPGNWMITNDGGNCVWQIFSSPYPCGYSLPVTSVSPVFSADNDNCGYGKTTLTTAAVINNINCIGYENITLEFDNDWLARPWNPDSAIVEVSYNNGSNWDTIISWGGEGYGVRNTHECKSLPGATNNPNLKVRFRTKQYTLSWWTIDNVTIKGDLGTGFPIPLAPMLVSPENGATLVATNPLLNWNNSLYTESYRVQVSTDSLFASTVYDSSGVPITEFQIPNNGLNINTTYYWRVNATNVTGTSPWSIIFHFTTGTTNITLNSEVPKEFRLYDNYPNPFNPTTKIKFDIPKSSYVKLIVYDVLGREIKTLVNEKLNAGRYDVDWPAPSGDGSNYPSGVYFYRLVTDEYVSVKKMLLIK